jgi:hypothetical protein
MYPSCMLSDAQRTSQSLTSIAHSGSAKHTMGRRRDARGASSRYWAGLNKAPEFSFWPRRYHRRIIRGWQKPQYTQSMLRKTPPILVAIDGVSLRI